MIFKNLIRSLDQLVSDALPVRPCVSTDGEPYNPDTPHTETLSEITRREARAS
jgi:hypothetical protein